MKTANTKLKEIKESLHRIDMGLRTYILSHQNLFDAQSYQKWESQNQIESAPRHGK